MNTLIAEYNGTRCSYYYESGLRLAALINDLPWPGADMAIGLAYNSANQIFHYTRDNDAYAWGGGVSVSRDYAVNGQNQYAAPSATASRRPRSPTTPTATSPRTGRRASPTTSRTGW